MAKEIILVGTGTLEGKTAKGKVVSETKEFVLVEFSASRIVKFRKSDGEPTIYQTSDYKLKSTESES